MDSTPPAKIISPSSHVILRAASIIAAKPEAHKRFTVCAGVRTSNPAIKAALRATLRESSPAWLVSPINTSSKISFGS